MQLGGTTVSHNHCYYLAAMVLEVKEEMVRIIPADRRIELKHIYWTKGSLNDLWVFNLKSETWAWIYGSEKPESPRRDGKEGDSPSDKAGPGACEGSVGWYDSAIRNLWVFGGNGFIEGSHGAHSFT